MKAKTMKTTLRGRKLFAEDGSVVAEIVGRNDGTTRRAPHSFGGYGYTIVATGETTTRDWAYFADAVRAARLALRSTSTTEEDTP